MSNWSLGCTKRKRMVLEQQHFDSLLSRRAIAAMGLSSVLIDFVKWDDRVRHHIASELDVAPNFDYIHFNYPDSLPVISELDQDDWETVWRIVYQHLPEDNHSKIKVMVKVDKPLHKDEINQLIKDFKLTPV